MQKKSGILFAVLFLSVTLINFTSAQFYGRFSLSDFFNSVDESLIVLGLIFVIVFALLNYSLSKFFKGNKGVSGVVSMAVALLVVYGINRSGYNYGGLFNNFFFFLPTGLIETIWPIVAIGLLIVCWVRYSIFKGTGIFLMWIGGALMFFSWLGFFYESGGSLGIGIVLLIIGLVIRFFGAIRKGVKRKSKNEEDEGYDSRETD